MAVDIEEKEHAIVHGRPHALFETRLISPSRNRWTVTPDGKKSDGKKFLAIVPREQKASTSVNVIVNRPSRLRK
jgi:hypothetical protein